ncbi:MAG TPA: RNA 3'-terminal phosphate cyclase [Candidatus Acidoferrales bacterium]|nr:RNA 3'-terminal phosphate cyclase [Candidatus Acidoferrales bacterium]
MLEIAGDFMEGGGQIVRTALALSALTGKPVSITKIRENRPNPGLQAQHFIAAKALAAVCSAETTGLAVGSRELKFVPHDRVGGGFTFDVGTAGSIPLVLQALMPAAAYAPSSTQFELTGGTDVRWSPTIDYVRLVQFPLLTKMGYEATIDLHRRGHYPKGGGRVAVNIRPSHTLKAVRWLERGDLTEIEGISHCVKLPKHVAERQANAATQELNNAGLDHIKLATETYAPNQDHHLAPGSGLTLAAKFATGAVLGADSLGERGKPAEKVGKECAEILCKEISSGAPVDKHMGDIMIPYLAVADGMSEIRVSEITPHTITNIKVAEILTGVQIKLEGELRRPGRITVSGMGLKT